MACADLRFVVVVDAARVHPSHLFRPLAAPFLCRLPTPRRYTSNTGERVSEGRAFVPCFRAPLVPCPFPTPLSTITANLRTPIRRRDVTTSGERAGGRERGDEWMEGRGALRVVDAVPCVSLPPVAISRRVTRISLHRVPTTLPCVDGTHRTPASKRSKARAPHPHQRSCLLPPHLSTSRRIAHTPPVRSIQLHTR